VVKISKLRMILSAVSVFVFLAVPTAAMAQSSSVGGYGGQGGSPSSVEPSTLPFTGLDVGLLAGGGLLLLLIGLAMTRLVPRGQEH
jgi:hypothetical protein